jgi:Mg-chelatase subunit ChlD
MDALDKSPLQDLILWGATMLSAHNWALVQPYFNAVRSLPQKDDFIERWTLFARYLADWDIDVAIAFLNQTPGAIEAFGPGNLTFWGEQALEALEAERRTGKAAKAYLEKAVSQKSECVMELPDWKFSLQQAARISKVSPSAAEAFIRYGARVCLLLNDEETEKWVAEGLECSHSEEELIKYFSGISFKAVEKRDGLASGVTLQEKANTLSLICEAYLGRPVRIRANNSLVGVIGFTGGAATDGRTIYLPEVVPNFQLLKLMALHQSSLLQWEGWRESSAKSVFDLIQIHLKADRNLLDKFPAFLPRMEQLAEGGLPQYYPSGMPKDFRQSLPWWGDLLPELVRETEATVQKLMLKAEERADLPPEVIEALLSYMMAEGHRDDKGLWERLQEIFDNLEFASPDAEELQESFKTFLYKEWDMGLSDYKVDWCLVRQRLAKDEPNPFVEEVRTRLHGLITLIRRQFMRLKPERFQKFRAQPIGDALDIDALVQAVVDMRSGSFLSENVYIRRDKRTRDVAVLFLVDMSASTEERVNGHRVIDIQKEAMVLMAEALESLRDPFAIYGFSSEGRFRVDLFTVKDFGERYGERVQYRLGSLEPKQLTRLGAAIRHGIYKLDGVQALIKLMVILTDGRPYDLEYGNLSYAIADTKKALQEARQHKIHPFIITSDQKGSDYIRRICPITQSIVVPRVELLPLVLPAMYKRLTT